MALSKDSNGRAHISGVTPAAAIPGGEFQIRGKGLARSQKPQVTIGDVSAPIVIGSDSYLVVRVPDGAGAGDLVVETGDKAKPTWSCDVGVQIADNLYPVANPAVDAFGNVYVTFSGSRGQKTPVSVYKIDLNYTPKPFVTDVMNATGLALDNEGMLYVSSRYDGIVYQVTPSGSMSVYVEGMGVATGICLDSDENMYVGDRSGTIFKISRTRQIYVFATLEPSIAAYHLALSLDGNLYVSGPTTSSFDCIHRIAPTGEVDVYYRGLGRPQGMAVDAAGRLYIAASLGGRRGVIRFDANAKPELFLSGNGIVGMAFTPSRSMMICTNNALYRVDIDIAGKPLP